MTRTLRGSLLIASMLIATWATTSEACHRRRASHRHVLFRVATRLLLKYPLRPASADSGELQVTD